MYVNYKHSLELRPICLVLFVLTYFSLCVPVVTALLTLAHKLTLL